MYHLSKDMAVYKNQHESFTGCLMMQHDKGIIGDFLHRPTSSSKYLEGAI